MTLGFKGDTSATRLFLFTSGNDKLNCLKETNIPNHQEE